MGNFENKQSDLVDLLINLQHTASDNFAIDLICSKYPLSLEQIEIFQNVLNWQFISRNYNINWTPEYVIKFKDKFDWRIGVWHIFENWSIEDVIETYNLIGKNIPWGWLSSSTFLPWSIKFIDKYIDDWDWDYLSANKSLPWDEDFLDYYQDKLIFNGVDETRIQLFNSIKDERHWYSASGNVFINPSINWDIRLINKYLNKICWNALSANSGLNWNYNFIKKYNESWDWNHLSANSSICWNENLITQFSYKINWKCLSLNLNAKWSEQLIELYKDKIEWKSLSENIGIEWNLRLFEKYIDKWDFDYLCKNPSFPWTEEIIEQYAERINFYSLSSNTGFNWTDEFIDKFSDRLNWDSSDETGEYIGLEWNNLPWTVEFAKKHENDTVWVNYAYGYENFYEKLIHPYINDKMVEKIFNSIYKNMKIVCLANSFRVGGRCLGGIELDQNNNPVIQNGRPKWIRPVCNTEHEEVPTHLVSHISLLDIVEFQAIQATGHGHQSENVLFNTNSIQTNGRFPISRLNTITDNNRFNLLFVNRGAAVPEHLVDSLNHSLMLLELTNFETNERIFEGKPFPQIKLSFKHNENLYNFPITDPSFLHKYGINNNILQGKQRVYVSLSLAAPHEGWSSKLIAGIIFDNVANVQPSNFNDDDLPF